MQRGSVRALLNVLPDPTGRDARSAMALAGQLVKQGADAGSLLRLRVVTKTVRLIEITAPGTRKLTTLQDWRALLPSSAPKMLVEPLKSLFPIQITIRCDDRADFEHVTYAFLFSASSPPRRKHNLCNAARLSWMSLRMNINVAATTFRSWSSASKTKRYAPIQCISL